MLLALAGGLATGVLMGALGGGGAILAIPLLVYVFGFTPAQATLASLVVVGIGAVPGVLTQARTLDWRRGTLFGALGLAGAYGGRVLAQGLDERLLLLAFATLLLVVSSLMVRTARKGSVRVSREDASPHPSALRQGVALVGAATGVGFLTGFFGVGGGFAIVPALTLILGLSMGVAVGTSLLIILINSLVALALGAGALPSLDWAALAPLLATTIVGTLAGTWGGKRLPQPALQLAFALFLYAVAAYMVVTTLIEIMA